MCEFERYADCGNVHLRCDQCPHRNKRNAVVPSAGVSVTADEATLPNGDTAGCGAETNSPAALVGTKKVYIKPLRTIVEVQAAYADQIRDWLNAAPVDAGVREDTTVQALVARIRRCKQHQAGSRVLFDLGFLDSIEREALLSALASSQPVFDREKIEQITRDAFNEGFAQGLKDYTSFNGGYSWHESKAWRAIVDLAKGGRKP